MSKVVHLSDHAHNKAKAFCQTRGLKMSEWVASLIDGATDGRNDVGTLPPPQMASGTIDPAHQPSQTPTAPSIRASDVDTDGAPYQALVQKKKLAQAVSTVQSMPDNSAPIYEAPPFWAR